MERERLINLLSAVDSCLNGIKAKIERYAPIVLDHCEDSGSVTSRSIRDTINFAKDILREVMEGYE